MKKANQKKRTNWNKIYFENNGKKKKKRPQKFVCLVWAYVYPQICQPAEPGIEGRMTDRDALPVEDDGLDGVLHLLAQLVTLENVNQAHKEQETFAFCVPCQHTVRSIEEKNGRWTFFIFSSIFFKLKKTQFFSN